MQVSQIYLSDANDELSPYLRSCTDAVRIAYPQFSHIIYNKEMLRQFLADNFGAEVVSAYDKLNPYAYKADLGRYCLLYALGGWYFDISVRLLNPLAMPEDVEALAFRDIQINSGTSWACSIAVLYSRKGNKVFETAIEYVIENCKNEYYGISPLCPTGPTLLGRAFALHGANKNHIFGDLLILTPYRKNRNAAFVMPDGTIFAFAKPSTGGDLTELGAKGTNNYNAFYHARNVYKS